MAWFENYTREAIAAPVNLENAAKYAWYRIPASDWISRPGVIFTDVNYLQDRLAQHADANSGLLKRQIDARFSKLKTLDEAGKFDDPGHCAWIMKIPPADNRPTKIQVEIFNYCSQQALPALYKRILTERITAFDVRLATLPHLNVDYPGDRLQGAYGTIGADIASTYARELDGRLKSAEPAVVADIVGTFQTRALGSGPLETDIAQCKTMLRAWYPEINSSGGDTMRGRGPGSDDAARFGHAVKAVCLRQAAAWLTRQGPEVTAAVQAGLAALDPARERILSVQARCTAVLGHWFSQVGDFERKLTDPVSQACHEGTEAFNSKAVETRARALTARLETAPRTLEGLERNTWFEPTEAEIQAVIDPRDPRRNEVEKALRGSVGSLVQPAREAALKAARTEIASLYDTGGVSDVALVPARRLCGPYFNDGTRALPTGGGTVRPHLVKACKDGEAAVLNRRLEAAITASHLDEVLGTEALAMSTPGGGLVAVNPREFVAWASLNGLQVSFVRKGLFRTPSAVRVVPIGEDNPALVAALTRVDRADGTRLWRLDDMPTLLGLSSPLHTLACLMVNEAQASTGIGAELLIGIVAQLVGLHRTGDGIMSNAVGAQMDLNVCKGARASYFGAAHIRADQGATPLRRG